MQAFVETRADYGLEYVLSHCVLTVYCNRKPCCGESGFSDLHMEGFTRGVV